MDGGSRFHQYLVGRKVPDKVVKALKKEAVTNEQTLKAMNNSDIESLKKKYKLSSGQLVLLREARDELARGAQASAKGSEYNSDDVEREYRQGDTTPLLTPSPDQQQQARGEKRRLKGDEIRNKYKLPSRSNASSSSAAPSPAPLPQHYHSLEATDGLAGTSQMKALYRKGLDRGEKIGTVEHKSYGLLAGAMRSESMYTQLADDYKSGNSKKRDKKDVMSVLEPLEEGHEGSRIRRIATFPQPQQHRRTHLQVPHQSSSHTPSPSPSPEPYSDPTHLSPYTAYVPLTEVPAHQLTTPTSVSHTRWNKLFCCCKTSSCL